MILPTLGAGAIGFVTAYFMFKGQQKAAGCPAYRGGEIPRHGPFKEYSVIYTDRAMNMLSPTFTKCMQDINRVLCKVYNCSTAVLIPGSGTYGMEACARHFGTDKNVMIIRNGYFSYRWSDIFQVTGVAKTETVLKAQPIEEGKTPSFAPPPLPDVLNAIKTQKPDVVFAPHVETSTGMILPNIYMKKVAEAVHSYGGVFVLDCVASGNVWVDMDDIGIDCLVTAPQKGWTGPACVGIVMMSERARKIVSEGEAPELNSFCCNLKQWLSVMDAYVAGGAKYYTTLPTDSLMRFRNVLLETEKYGFEKVKNNMWELGKRIRKVLESHGFKSVSAAKVQSPGVVVSYSPYEGMYAAFKQENLQIAGGVPFKLGEEKLGIDARKQCFRLGLFGLDKMKNIPEVVRIFEEALGNILKNEQAK